MTLMTYISPRSRAVRTLAAAVLAAAGLTATAASGQSVTATTAAPDATIVNEGAAGAIDNEYIVVFKDQRLSPATSRSKAKAMAAKHGGTIYRQYGNTIDGYAAHMTATQARKVAADPQVGSVEQSVTMTIADVQPNPPNWGDDRIDQLDTPLDSSYEYPPNAGSGVHVYVMDTGIRATHIEFTGRVGNGRDIVSGDDSPDDCHGHGSHVAGTAVGTTYGVAKRAALHGVRVLNCQGSGSSANIIAGIDWVRVNAVRPAVVNYSIGCQSRCTDAAIESAVTNLISSGVQWVQAAGNSNDDACFYSPQRMAAPITVGNSTISDARASSSNWGTCLDVFAPGTNIVSAWYTGDTATNTISGTSMASPHAAGAAALHLGANPSATPAQVHAAIVDNSSPNTLTGVGTGSPNRLLNMDYLNGGTPGQVTVANPGPQTSTVGTAVNRANSASGGTAPYTWSATGLPPGLTISASTGTITGTPTTAGSYNVTVTATDSSSPPKSGSASFTWTVNPVGTCTPQTNGTDFAISDFSTINSPVTISGCSGNASATAKVAVNIVHTYIGDLVVSLVAPDGSVYVLHNRSGGSADNINTTYTVNLSSEMPNGTWSLRVADQAGADTGRLDTWTLDPGGGTPPPTCAPVTNGTDFAINDFSTIESPVTVSGCSGNASATAKVAVNIVHTYIGDLVVSLVAPDGSVYVLHNRSGGSADNINTTYTVNLSSEVRNGTWRLRVADQAGADTGRLDTWTLTL